MNSDYSRGASGFWIENGEISYPVHEGNGSSNLDRMLCDDLRRSDRDLRRSLQAQCYLRR